MAMLESSHWRQAAQLTRLSLVPCRGRAASHCGVVARLCRSSHPSGACLAMAGQPCWQCLDEELRSWTRYYSTCKLQQAQAGTALCRLSQMTGQHVCTPVTAGSLCSLVLSWLLVGSRCHHCSSCHLVPHSA